MIIVIALSAIFRRACHGDVIGNEMANELTGWLYLH